jgi:hypothetical protein
MLVGWEGMTSDSDDLEEALRQNLKLRSELAAEVAKAKGGGIAYRLGWVLYWIGIAIAVGWAAFMLWFSLKAEGALEDLQQSPELLLVIALPTLIAYGLGRAFRYVLSGE